MLNFVSFKVAMTECFITSKTFLSFQILDVSYKSRERESNIQRSFPSLAISLTTKSISCSVLSWFVMTILQKLTRSPSGWYPHIMVPCWDILFLISMGILASLAHHSGVSSWPRIDGGMYQKQTLVHSGFSRPGTMRKPSVLAHNLDRYLEGMGDTSYYWFLVL